MIEDGVGGGRTITGIHFERKVDILSALSKIPGYRIEGADIFFNDVLVATSLRKQALYRWLLLKGVDFATIVSKQWWPDEALLVHSTKTLHVIEMKFQQVGGSVDEKLQTCDFKKKTYTKLLAPLNISVEYMYILSEWFNKPGYKDTLDYILSVGCYYYFEELPFEKIGMPIPIVKE